MKLAWLLAQRRLRWPRQSASDRRRRGGEYRQGKAHSAVHYEIDTSGDYDGAARTMREYAARYPRDVEGLKGLARLLRMQGNLQGALSFDLKG